MAVVVPPMIFGSMVELVEVVEPVELVELVVPAAKFDFDVVAPAVPSPLRAPAIRSLSTLSEGELVAGLTFGVGSGVTAFADDIIKAPATAAAIVAAPTGTAIRIRRL